MAYKLQLKRGVLASLPNGSVGEPLFTTDTFDLYVGKGDGTNVKIQKFIASGSSSQFIKGDGSLDSNTYIGLTALSASAPLSYNNTTGAFTISQASGSTNGYLSSGDWTTFNAKQAALSGSGIVKSTGGIISYLTDNTANWDTAYNDKINSASVSGTTTKTLTLTQQDGGTITTSWSDYDTAPVTSVFGRTGAVVAANGDYTTSQVTEGTNLYYTDARARAAITLTTTGSSGASTYVGGTLNIPTYTLAGLGGVASSRQLTINGTSYDLSADRTWSVGTVTSVNMSVPTGFAISGNPITSSGTLALAFAAGYSLPTTSSQANWDAAYNDKINSASVTGTTTKTLTLTQQDGGTITASWTDINTDAVTSVFGRTGAVVAQSGDYTTTQVTEGTNLYYTEGRVSANTDVAANTAARHNAVTLGTANGLSLSTQQLSLALASGSTTGALSSTDWTTFNNKENAITAGTTLQYYRGDKTFQTLNTSVVPESGNLYYTDARSRAALSFVAGSGAYNSTTGVITIPTNTNQLTNGASFITLASLSGGAGISYNNTTGVIASTITQYTDAMARASISGGTGISYNSTTGVITNTITQYTDAMARASLSFVAGSGAYNSTTGVITIPTNTSQLTNGANFITLASLSGTAPIQYNNSTGVISITQAGTASNGFLSSTDWNTFNNKQGALTLTTTGTSGAATLVGNTLNIPQYQSVITNPVTGTGTTNYVSKWTSSSAIGNSQIYDNGTNVGIGTNNPLLNLQINSALGSNSTLAFSENNVLKWYTRYNAGDGSFSFVDVVNTATRLIITNTGNLGLGVTPSAWGSGGKLQVGSGQTIGSVGNGFVLASNWYYNAGDKFAGTGYASYYNQQGGTHTWNTSTTSGNVGDTATMTQAMTLTSGGNLLVGTSTDAGYRLFVNGDISAAAAGQIYLTSGDLRYNSNAGYGIVSQNGSRLVTIQNGAFGVNGAATFSSSVTAASVTSTSRFIVNSTSNSGITDISIGSYAGGLWANTPSGTAGYLSVAGSAAFSFSSSNLRWYTDNGSGIVERMRLDAPGNLGLGVTPSAWDAGIKAFEIFSSGNAIVSSTSSQNIITTNARYVGGGWQYGSNGLASTYQQQSGVHTWNLAPSGTAGAAISFTQAMTLFSTGNLAVGGTSDAGYRLYVNGSAGFFNNGLRLGTAYSAIDVATGASGLYLSGSQGALNHMFINPSGNVGIGTTSPSEKLEVNGNIKTAAPTGYTAQPWKLGDATSGTLTPNYYIKVEINGQIYSIPALQGTP